MPNKNTFEIKEINNLIMKYERGLIVDAFANESQIATVTNDINEKYDTNYNMDALKFLKEKIKNDIVDLMLFDPPYSTRQVKEVYENIGRAFTQRESIKFYTDIKYEISKKIKIGGHCISFGWNSIGIGKKNGFRIVEILLVSHGGIHNDTICTVEKKELEQLKILKGDLE